MFSSRIPLKALSPLCHSLSTMLNAGVDIRRALKVSADKSGNAQSKNAMQQISISIRRGETIADSMKKVEGAFPPLMIDMVHMGEETGALPEVLAGLANHYENITTQRRQFLSAITFPLIQIFLVTFIITALLWIAGYIAGMLGIESPTFFGMDLLGKEAAITWLISIYSLIAGGVVFYIVMKCSVFGNRLIDPLLMQIPLVGKCMRAFAVSRFSWAFYLTQQTGMPITQSIDESLKATGNGLFIAASPMMQRQLKQGKGLVDAWQDSQLFPPDFIEMAAVAETSGTVPEELHRLSPHFEEEARRRLSALSTGFSYLVWGGLVLTVITILVTCAMAYAKVISDLSSGLDQF